jgi:glucose-6-phosphate-specific signal transduction histidine kinase
MTGFIVKVFALSTLISVAIKYGAPYLAVSETNPIALIAVVLPSILMAIALGWRSRYPKL